MLRVCTKRRAVFYCCCIGYRLITAYTIKCCSVETSCHKHFVVFSRHQQTPPLTTSDKCHNLPRSGGTVLITPGGCSVDSMHAVKPDIGSESRLLPTPPALDAPVKASPSEYRHDVWYEKKTTVRL